MLEAQKSDGERMRHFIVDGRYKELLKYYGLDIRKILRRAMLPEDILNHRTINMQEEEYYRFMEAIALTSEDPGLSVRLATIAQIESFSPPIFAAYCSKNGRMCIKRLARYKKLIGPMSFVLGETENDVSIEVVPGDYSCKLPRFLVESEFAFLIGMIRKATGRSVVPVRVEFTENSDDSTFAEFAGIMTQPSMKNRITFSRNDLELPFITYNEAMWDYFQPELTKRLVDLDADESVSSRVRSALTELLPGGLFGIDDVAEKLGMSRRTLQRKLTEEKTTFQKQLNCIREEMALHYIENTDMSTADIAYLLGYSEVNSFLRAFAAWTGKNLSDYRAG